MTFLRLTCLLSLCLLTACRARVPWRLPRHYDPVVRAQRQAYSLPADSPAMRNAVPPPQMVPPPARLAELADDRREFPEHVATFHAGMRRLPLVVPGEVQTVSHTEPVETEGVPASGEASTAWTLAELEQAALTGNPALARANAQVRALRGKWVQAGLPPNPLVGYSAAEVGDAGGAGLQGARISQAFITGGKLGLARAAALQEIRQAQQQYEAVRLRVLTDVRTAYYEVLIAERKLQVTAELVEASDEAVRASRGLLEAKEIARVALLQTEIEAQNARIELRRAENAERAAWRTLASVVGRKDLQPRTLAGNLDETRPPLHWPETLERLQSESPEIAAALFELSRARWELSRAIAQVRPDVDVQMTVQQDDASDLTVAGVQVLLPLPLLNRNQGAIGQAESEMIAARRNVEQVELRLQNQLAQAFQGYSNAQYQVARYTGAILPKARETFEFVGQAYRTGEASYIELLNAQRTFFRTNLAYLDALQTLWREAIRIEGLLLEGSLQ